MIKEKNNIKELKSSKDVEEFINSDFEKKIMKDKSYLQQIKLKMNLKYYERYNKKEFEQYKNNIIKKSNQIKKLKESLKILEESRKDKLFEFKNEINPNKSLNFYLISDKEELYKDKGNPKGLKKFFSKDYSGYITYFSKVNDMKIIECQNLRELFNLNKREAYAIYKYVGTYKNKPNFLVKYPYPITLEFIKKLKENKEFEHLLALDCESFYNYIEKVDITKLSKPQDTTTGSPLFNFITNNLIWIILGVSAVFLLFTEQGRVLFQQLAKAFSLKPK